jgi:hypothetical protein
MDHQGDTQDVESSEPRESDVERLNRNLTELLGELRVALPGVQVLFAFLLAVPFSQRFGRVGPFERIVYRAVGARLLTVPGAGDLPLLSTAPTSATGRATKQSCWSARPGASARRHSKAQAFRSSGHRGIESIEPPLPCADDSRRQRRAVVLHLG